MTAATRKTQPRLSEHSSRRYRFDAAKRAVLLHLKRKRAEAFRKMVEAQARGDPIWEGYLGLYMILNSVEREMMRYNVIASENTYILSGALWIAAKVIEGTLDVDTAAHYVMFVKRKAIELYKVLVHEKKLKFLVPKDIQLPLTVYLWVDYSKKDDVYVLTMYFYFPYDIHPWDNRSEFEPISVIFEKRGGRYVPAKAAARVHYDHYSYNIEDMSELTVVFTSSGHTPKILGANPSRESKPNILKEVADRLWLAVGEIITRFGGYRAVDGGDMRNIRLVVSHRLPRTVNNVFKTKPNPYYVRKIVRPSDLSPRSFS